MNYLNIFLVFLKMGIITFGGGYAMVPIIDRELIKQRGWTNMDEILDYYTIAQVTPGIIAVNMSTFIGYKRGGWLWGLLATLGFVLPGACIMIVVSIFLQHFAQYPVVQHIFAGIRVAVGGLILDTVIKLCKGVFKKAIGIVLFIIVFLLSAVLSANPVLLVVGAGLVGLLIFHPKKDAPVQAAKDGNK
jgi:chromate transporter